jgi:hypothetical protein
MLLMGYNGREDPGNWYTNCSVSSDDAAQSSGDAD